MDHYRILILDRLGQVTSSSVCNVTTDDAALVAASWWTAMQQGVEVWKGPRLVGALAALPASKAGHMTTIVPLVRSSSRPLALKGLSTHASTPHQPTM